MIIVCETRDNQHNDIQHIDTQHKGPECDSQHKWLTITNTQHNHALHYAECLMCWMSYFIYCYAECLFCWVSLRWVSLCWVSLCWVSLCWVSLCWVSLCWMSLCWVSFCRVSWRLVCIVVSKLLRFCLFLTLNLVKTEKSFGKIFFYLKLKMWGSSKVNKKPWALLTFLDNHGWGNTKWIIAICVLSPKVATLSQGFLK